MKRLLVILGALVIILNTYSYAACIQGSGTCNDTINPQEVLSDEDIQLLINLGTIKVTEQEIEKYGLEQIKAYYWAYENGITTQPSIDKANMKGKITREEMAKMISNYAMNILGKTPDTTKSCLFSDSNINPDLFEYITKSCQLGLMGQGVTSFKPKDSVTRAEFGTVLSRALRGNQYEGGSTYYENHLKALKAEGIMNKIDTPMDKEIRGYVMLMLMRSGLEHEYIQSYDDEDYTEYGEIEYVMKMLD